MLLVVLGIVHSVHDADASNPKLNSATRPRLSVVVHRGGGRVVAGNYDNAKRWASHTVKASGVSEVTMPAFEGTEAEWRGMLACVRSQYSGLPVDFVEQAPPTGDYLLLVVGGTSRALGQSGLWGLASTGPKAVVNKGVGFVFSAGIRAKDRTIALCETVTHEVGHMIGLDHSADCNDVMSDNPVCTNRDYKRGALRMFRQANWSVLASSLGAWTKANRGPETRITDNASDKSPTTRALVVPKQK